MAKTLKDIRKQMNSLAEDVIIDKNMFSEDVYIVYKIVNTVKNWDDVENSVFTFVEDKFYVDEHEAFLRAEELSKAETEPFIVYQVGVFHFEDSL